MPTVLLTVLGQREIWRSLDTDSFATALRRIHRIAADVESEFEKARGLIGCAADPVLLAPVVADPTHSGPPIPAAPQPPLFAPPSSTRTLSDVYNRFIADPKHTWSKRTQIAHATTRKWVIEMFGEDTPLTGITREGCRDFVALLREMPRNAHQRFPNMTIREVVAAAKAKGERRLISTANLNAYINRFGGVVNWAMNEGYLDRNPLKGLKLPDPVKKRDKRNPFSAMAEFDEIGRAEFLAKYGFRPARSFFVIENGKRYDSKAIAGAAYGYQHPQRGPMAGRDFVGGDATVRPKLEGLGFMIVSDNQSEVMLTSNHLELGRV